MQSAIIKRAFLAKYRQIDNYMKNVAKLPASFRDPSGFLFELDNVLYRQVNNSFRDDYDLLIQSGLYKLLSQKGYLVEHEEADVGLAQGEGAYKVIRPKKIDFISYPYEWCFSQYRDAALLTLEIQRLAVEHGMILKDASAYNIQFNHGQPVLIDTLSFEKYVQGQPWVAYRQFCQHFLAPLALMAKKDFRLSKLLLGYIDGIPLDLASTLLPASTWLNPGLAFHLRIHAKTQRAYSDSSEINKLSSRKPRPVSKNGLLGIISGLDKAVRKLKSREAGTEWGEYYKDTNYSEEAFDDKKSTVKYFLEAVKPARVWDLGSNTGVFSRLASAHAIKTVSFDIDPAAIEYNYRMVRENNENNLLPLIFDLTNPSPGIGWENRERNSLIQRGPVDCIMALALIHHLVISNNVPFERIASFFSRLCLFLIIEFVPKNDSQVKRLLASRKDIFGDYKQESFEKSFSCFFDIIEAKGVKDSKRTLYLMKNKNRAEQAPGNCK